ncbi:MAG TPA: transcription elongation factor GreA [Candidatus Omnitrophota bacterium]|nr:transcription elongation factor GreA [Candidatus Omnitrophota bacterium]HQJ16053.1 transcription elongation factor GreA [Candidatus Omnitrophota bacterium]
MASDDIYLTQAGYEKLVHELEFLKNEKRRSISKAIAEARSHGDLSENAEYDAAKDAQAANEAKIGELEFKLSRCRIIENENIPSDEILIGATALLLDTDTNREYTYTLVSELEADYEQGKISVTSPLGKGLIGHKQGEDIQITVPAGTRHYKVLKISRA